MSRSGRLARGMRPSRHQPLLSPFCSWRPFPSPRSQHPPPQVTQLGREPRDCHPPQNLSAHQLLCPVPGNPCRGSLAPCFLSGGSPGTRGAKGGTGGPNLLWFLFSHGPTKLGVGGEALPSIRPCNHTAAMVMGLGWGEKKTPTPRFPPQAPTSLYLFIYLGKGPTAQAGNGPISGGSAGLGNKEPHCAPCPAAPHPGPAAGAQRGGSAWGPGRKEAWGQGLPAL